MVRLLRFAGTFNLCAGLTLCVFYHEGFKLLALVKPEPVLYVQLVGVLVGLFGVGYHLVASHPLENRNLLMLGFWSKALGTLLALYHVALLGTLPWRFMAIVLFADIVYLPPFWIILRAIDRARSQTPQATAV
jgi:hypothetical protein